MSLSLIGVKWLKLSYKINLNCRRRKNIEILKGIEDLDKNHNKTLQHILK